VFVQLLHSSSTVRAGWYYAIGEPYSDCPSTGGQNDTRFWLTEQNGSGSCHAYSTGGLATYEAVRDCNTCSSFDVYFNGTFKDNTGALFSGTVDDIHAGGSTNRDDLLGYTLCANIGAGAGPQWQRTAQSNNETKSWTTITSSQLIEQGHWSVGPWAGPGLFPIAYNQTLASQCS
jgi:hypothetical protein